MKTKLHLLAVLIISTNLLFAQEVEPFICGSIMPPTDEAVHFSPLNNSAYSGSVDPEYLANFEPISINIFFWGVNRSDGTSDYLVDGDIVSENMKRINEFFNPLNICFKLTGFNYINMPSDDLYDSINLNFFRSYVQDNGYVISNSINVYVHKYFRASGTIIGEGFGNGPNRIVISQSKFFQQNWSGNTDHIGVILAHEIGHIFHLYHTFGGTSGQDLKEEHVTRDPSDPNYNALTKGDMIHDTPAMPNFRLPNSGAIVDPDNSEIVLEFPLDEDCNYTGETTDLLGVPYDLTPYDVGNIMSYAPERCHSGFTIGQAIRMREYILGLENSSESYPILQAINPVTPDLYIRDSPEDLGIEPNTISLYSWKSEDIWIRNQNDGIEEHQNPEYHSINPNYIYVRISNRGCGTSEGTEKLNLYWAKATTGLIWDYNWKEQNTFENGKPVGGKITTIDIPPVAPNESVVISIPWENMPSPYDYFDINYDPWHFCLLAIIEADNDPMTFLEIWILKDNVLNNNNIAQKNITIVDLEPDSNGRALTSGVIAVGNIYDTPKCYSLEFVANGNEIVKEVEISIELDNNLQTIWEKGGKQEHKYLN